MEEINFSADQEGMHDKHERQIIYNRLVASVSDDSLIALHSAIKVILGNRCDGGAPFVVSKGRINAHENCILQLNEFSPEGHLVHNKALASIRVGKLYAIDSYKFRQSLLPSALPKDVFDQVVKCFSKMRSYPLVNFREFVQWAIREKILLCEELQIAIGFQQHPPTKPECKKWVSWGICLAITYNDSEISQAKLAQHTVHKAVCKQHAYHLRDKEAGTQFKKIIRSLDCAQPEKNILAIEVICKSIINALHLMSSEISWENDILQHPLLAKYLNGFPPFLRDITRKWPEEIKTDYPLDLDWFCNRYCIPPLFSKSKKRKNR